MHLLILGLVNQIKKNQTANKYILFLTEAYWLILSTPHNGHEADNLFLPPPQSRTCQGNWRCCHILHPVPRCYDILLLVAFEFIKNINFTTIW